MEEMQNTIENLKAHERAIAPLQQKLQAAQAETDKLSAELQAKAVELLAKEAEI